MKIQPNKRSAFLQFPEFPAWFIYLCAGIFCIGIIVLLALIGRGIIWLIFHVRFI